LDEAARTEKGFEDEAALIDGAGFFFVLVSIIPPKVKPAINAVCKMLLSPA
jgi:ABC-type glycerol-3-phosphate transport system permease component